MRPRLTPIMTEAQRIPHYLSRLGLATSNIDVVFIGHLHFDHAGGLGDLPGCEVHIQRDELAVARTGLDGSVFTDELAEAHRWLVESGEYLVAPGVHAIASPGHTAGHMSLFVELERTARHSLRRCGRIRLKIYLKRSRPVTAGRTMKRWRLPAYASSRTSRERKTRSFWPNHDMEFFRSLPSFPEWRE